MKDLKLLNHQWFEKKKEGRLIFDPQKEIGKQIVKAFRKHLVITLCAPPQWGKTGVSLFVSYKMSLQKIENVFYLTGMSDRKWIEQIKERILPCWGKNVYHRNTLNRLLMRIMNLRIKKKDKNILLIIDECHIANRKEHMMSEIMELLI